MARAPETQLLEGPRWPLTKATADGNGSFNGAVGAFALENNTSGFSNNAVGDSALFNNHHWRCRIPPLVISRSRIMTQLESGDANFNTAVGASALIDNVNGSANTAVGAGAGPNLARWLQ